MERPRRQILRLAGTLSLGVLAGCSGSDNDADNENEDQNSTATVTNESRDEPTGETDDEPTDESGSSTRSQVSKLAADDGNEFDEFGASLALSDDATTAIIGAANHGEPNGDRAGSVYVFANEGGWSQKTKLVAQDGDSGDLFGWSVALSADGSTALIGARDDEDPNGNRAGSAYVFANDGGWSQQAKLTADDGTTWDLFGSVALSDDGTTALVGAYGDDDGDPRRQNAGAAYVFTNENDWNQQTKLTADDRDPEDDFGFSTALSDDGTTALIGTPDNEDPHGENAGAAYVFTNDGGWSQQAKLTADDGNKQDRFGWSVGLSDDGTTALIGAYQDGEPNGKNAGSAYVFTNNGSWSQQAKLAAGDDDEVDEFGWSVALSGDATAALIGARDDDSAGPNTGSAHLFTNDGGWSQQAELAAEDGDEQDRFGASVALSSNVGTALVGDDQDEDPNGEDAGSTYVFQSLL